MVRNRTLSKNSLNKSSGTLAPVLLGLICLLSCHFSSAQVYNEGFEVTGPYPQSNLPLGWTQGTHCNAVSPIGGPCTDPDNRWDVMGAGAQIGGTATPAVSPRTGTGMMRYFAFATVAGEKAFLASKRLDMTGMPVGGPAANGSVYMYRDNASNIPDSINVYVNTVPDMSGSPRLIGASNPIHRWYNLAPATTANTWYQVNFSIPSVAPFATSNSVYVIIVGISRAGRNIFLDDFSVQTYPSGPQVYNTGVPAAVVNQNIATTAPGQTNQQIIGLRVTTTGAGTPLGLRDVLFNTNGSTNPTTDIVNAKLYFTGGTNNFDLATAQLIGTYMSPHATNFTMLTTAFTGMENGDNYFWLTYDINGTATLGNYVDAEIVSFNTVQGVSVTSRIPSPVSLPGSRLINISYCTANHLWTGIFSIGAKRDYIYKVTLTGDVAPGINNEYNTYGPAGCSPCRFTPTPPGYDFFPPTVGRTASLSPDSAYSIAVRVGPGGGLLGLFGFTGGSYVAAWIDYNKSGTFEPAERLGQSGAIGNLGTATFNFTVPTAALAGNARLRVRTGWLTNPVPPCGSWLWGETEDFIVTIVPPCAPLWPGWKTWLGFTNDWDNPTNWCGGVPTPADNARIPGPGGPNGRPGDYSPVIKSGVFATAKNLRIESNDTIFVNAATAGSLVVDSTLLILDNSSALIINSNFSDSAQVSNGQLGPATVAVATHSPLKNTTKSRNIWMFTQDDLLSKGMLPGDVVTNLLMHVRRQSSNTDPYRNVIVKVYYTDDVNPVPTGFRFNGAPATASPATSYWNMPTIIGPAPVTVFTGDITVSSFIPIQGDWGTIDIPLNPGAFVWSGSTNKLVVDMSFDNQGFNNPNSIDYPSYTQTVGIQNFISITNFNKENLNYPANTMVVPMSLPVSHAHGTITGTVGTNVLTVTFPNATLAAGQWVNGVGVSFNQPTSLLTLAGTNTITMANVANIQVGHYVQGGTLQHGPMVTNIVGNVITISSALQANLAASSSLTFRPAITNVSGSTITLSANIVGALSGTFTFGSTNSTPTSGTDYRPNLTFKFDRPYDKFPIVVKRDWDNNGLFIPGESSVTFATSIWGGGQQITGNNVTSFYDLNISNSNHVLLNKDAIVTDSLKFMSGHLKLGHNLLTVTNNQPGAITRSGGGIQSDADALGSDVSPFGRVRWMMGSDPGNRTIPFINAAGDYLPLDYSISAGSHDVIFATYATPPDNQNIPLPMVTNIFGMIAPGSWGTNGNGMVDRYYMIDNTAGSGGPQADINFRYSNGERAGIGNLDMRAQRWLTTTSQWELPLLGGQTHTPGSPDVVRLDAFNQFSSSLWWTIVGEATPLPVSLLSFTAKPFKDKVRLNWVTASEYNNSHFEIERTVDNEEFFFIDRVQSRGPSTGRIDYQTWDLNPVQGTQYYYLRQHDIDGRSESFGPIAATFSKDLFDIVTVAISNTESGLSVVFNYDSHEPYSYKIIDMTGRTVAAKDRNPGEPGVNVIDIDTKLSKGVYQVILQNRDKMVTRKFFF